MKSHTIRNKNKPNPILTFTPKFFDLVQQDIEAFSLMWNWFTHTYKGYTGKEISIDYNQQLTLDSLFQNADLVNIQDLAAYRMHTLFLNGFIYGNHGEMVQAFRVAQYYYCMVRQHISAGRDTATEGVSTDEDLRPHQN